LVNVGMAAQAQSYQELVTKDKVTVKYKFKESKEGATELYIKFKNKAKSAVNVDAEVGFYINGIMEESAVINDCLKKSCFDNWFRPVQLIQNDSFNNEKFEPEDIKVEITEIKVEKIDECRETDS